MILLTYHSCNKTIIFMLVIEKYLPKKYFQLIIIIEFSRNKIIIQYEQHDFLLHLKHEHTH